VPPEGLAGPMLLDPFKDGGDDDDDEEEEEDEDEKPKNKKTFLYGAAVHTLKDEGSDFTKDDGINNSSNNNSKKSRRDCTDPSCRSL
jgi:hypothetical protein